MITKPLLYPVKLLGAASIHHGAGFATFGSEPHGRWELGDSCLIPGYEMK